MNFGIVDYKAMQPLTDKQPMSSDKIQRLLLPSHPFCISAYLLWDLQHTIPIIAPKATPAPSAPIPKRKRDDALEDFSMLLMRVMVS